MADRDYRSGGLIRRQPGAMGRSTGWGGAFADPWAEMAQMRRRMDDLFSTLFGANIAPMSAPWLAEDGAEGEPDVDLYENDSEYVVYAALPGVKPEDVHVEATEDSLRISAEYSSPMEAQNGSAKGADNQAGNGQGDEQNVRQHRQSRFSRQGRFLFTYTFPQEIRADGARADLNHGRLELHLPKVQQDASASRPKQIPVTASSGQTGGTGVPQLQSQVGGKQTAGRSGRETATPPGGGPPPNLEPAAEKGRAPRKKAA